MELYFCPNPQTYLRRLERGTVMEDASLRRLQQFAAFAICVLFSALAIGYLFYQPPTFSNLKDWVTLGGAIFLPPLAIINFFGMRNNWSDEQADQIAKQTFGYVVLAPIALIVAVLAGIMLFSAFGWFATIPSWAAIIIVLLVLIYLKLK
jgi:hypothetical protein